MYIENRTRFFVLGRQDGPPLPPSSKTPPVHHHSLLRISLHTTTITEVLSSLKGRVVQVDRYPDPQGKPFESYYLVEVENDEETLCESTKSALQAAEIVSIGGW
jgi:prephenate dehydratase